MNNIRKYADELLFAGNYVEANEYYSRVLESDVEDLAAWMGKAISIGSTSTIKVPRFEEMVRLFDIAIKKSDDTKSNIIKNEASIQIYNISKKYSIELNGWFQNNISLDSYNIYINRVRMLIDALTIAYDYNPVNKDSLLLIMVLTERVMKNYYRKSDGACLSLNKSSYEYFKDIFEWTKKLLQVYEPGFERELPKKKEGCFIATMVYNDYDSPEVIVLREFRDRFLMNKFYGRLFINLYYTISPLLVRTLKNSKTANSIIKDKILDRIVLNLKKRGY